MGNISAKKYQNPFMCVKVIASQRWDVFWDTVYIPSTDIFIRILRLSLKTMFAKHAVTLWRLG